MSRLSIEALKARGSWLARRRAEQGGRVLGTGGRLTCPQWLSVEARAVWRKTVRHLRPFGHLRPCDGLALARYCDAMVLHRRLVAVRDAAPDDVSAGRIERRLAKLHGIFRILDKR